MLRLCRKDRFVSVEEIRCFGADPRSDRSACVEDSKERESMFDFQNRWEGK